MLVVAPLSAFEALHVLYTLVLEETEAEARAKSDHWIEHADREALATMMG